MHLRVVTVALTLLSLVGVGALAPSPAAGGTARPNIVVILTDDVPAMDDRLWSYMPTISEMFVNHGTSFTNFQGESPLCCPGRAGFLTGQHAFNNGVTRNDARLFNPTMTIATALHDIGYRTFLAGKYFNLYNLIAPTVPPGWDGFHAYQGGYYNYDLWNDGNSTPEYHGTSAKDYSTDVIRSKALLELRRAPAGQPLFAWIAPFAPHGPITPAPRYLDDPRCNSIPAWDPANYNEPDVSDKPAYVQSRPLLAAPAYDLVKTCRTMLAVDDLVRDVRDELDRQGRLDNTLFILSTDNGMNAGAHRLLGKSTPYATRLPFYVSWPSVLGIARQRIDEAVANIDLAPTICDLVNCRLGPYPTPPPDGQQTPDGVSFLSLLLGRSDSLNRDALIQDLADPGPDGAVPDWYAIMTTGASQLASVGCSSANRQECRWHYVEYDTGEKELYDISGGPCGSWHANNPGDPCELQNLAGNAAYKAIRNALAVRLHELENQKGAGT